MFHYISDRRRMIPATNLAVKLLYPLAAASASLLPQKQWKKRQKSVDSPSATSTRVCLFSVSLLFPLWMALVVSLALALAPVAEGAAATDCDQVNIGDLVV